MVPMSDRIFVPLTGADVVAAACVDLERRPDGVLDEVLERGIRSLVIDMAGVDRVSSATVATLLRAHRRCAVRGVDIVLRRTSRQCREVLGRAGLARLMTF